MFNLPILEAYSCRTMLPYTLQMGHMVRGPPSWRLNEALLQSPEVRQILEAILSEYISLNKNSVDNPFVVWEAHKPVIRGTLIKIGARLKQKRTLQVDILLAHIRCLESTHKASIARSVHCELLKTREELNSLLFHKTKQKLAWSHCTMYEFSNKPGTLLARALCGPCTQTYIPTSSEQKLSKSDAITAEFHFFYDRPKPSPETSLGLSVNIHTYIASSGMPSLSSSTQ